VTHRVALLAGDGVGPEVVAEARKAVDALGIQIEWTDLPWGSAYWHEHGRMMPEDALEVVRAHDAILMGAVGDPSVPDHVSLWGLILELRQRLDLWANLRPARLLEGIPCPLAGRFWSFCRGEMIRFILALVIATSFVATAHADVIDLLRAGLAARSRDDFNEAIRRDPYIAPFYFKGAVGRVEPLSLPPDRWPLRLARAGGSAGVLFRALRWPNTT